MQLTADEKADLLKRQGRGGKHHFLCCPLCGYLHWNMNETREADDVVIDGELAVDRCPRCADVFQRAPEIVRWVIAVLSYKDRCKKEVDSSESR